MLSKWRFLPSFSEVTLGVINGHAHAQYKLGLRYEKGSDVRANPAEALRWYQKATAQGDVFAIQQLETSIPTK